MTVNINDVEINWNRKSCNTCSRGAVHHALSSKLAQNPYQCSVSGNCDRAFSQWTPHKSIKNGVNIEKALDKLKSSIV
jgi:hypothetical protein